MATKTNLAQVDMFLDGIIRLFEDKKPAMLETAKDRIIQMLLIDGLGYIDDIHVEDITKHHPNVVGSAVRSLIQSKRIKKTGSWKRSEREESKGRIIWEYQIL